MTVREHLISRHLDFNLHKVWVAEELNCASFAIWNLSGQLLGYQRYRPGASKALNNDPREGRYFTRLVIGYSAIATFSNNVAPSVAKWLWMAKQVRRVVAVCDNDAAGRSLGKYTTVSHTMDVYKDLGDASEEYVKHLVKEYA
jgi:hypothetical protein